MKKIVLALSLCVGLFAYAGVVSAETNSQSSTALTTTNFQNENMSGELYLTPENGIYTVAQHFDVQVLANTGEQSVRAIEAELAYSPNDFEVEKISIEKSILTSWSTTPAFDGAAGIIKFSGWLDKPYSGKKGLLLTVTLRPLRVAQSGLAFNSGAMLGVDARGGNMLASMKSGIFTIQPKRTEAAAIVSPQTDSTTTSSAPTPPQDVTQAPAPSTSVRPPDSTFAAATLLSGVSLAPVFVPFFVLLVLVAFGIAYILHRIRR